MLAVQVCRSLREHYCRGLDTSEQLGPSYGLPQVSAESVKTAIRNLPYQRTLAYYFR